MTILTIIVALLLLILGRRLYWLFVGGAGFLTAVALVNLWGINAVPWLKVIIALGAGIVGVVLALFLQKVSVAVAGFLAGGSITHTFWLMMGLQISTVAWILIALGAMIGLILSLTLFDWALIILSSVSGALLLAYTINVSTPLQLLICAVLLGLGIWLQASMMKKEKQ